MWGISKLTFELKNTMERTPLFWAFWIMDFAVIWTNKHGSKHLPIYTCTNPPPSRLMDSSIVCKADHQYLNCTKVTWCEHSVAWCYLLYATVGTHWYTSFAFIRLSATTIQFKVKFNCKLTRHRQTYTRASNWDLSSCTVIFLLPHTHTCTCFSRPFLTWRRLPGVNSFENFWGLEYVCWKMPMLSSHTNISSLAEGLYFSLWRFTLPQPTVQRQWYDRSVVWLACTKWTLNSILHVE